MSQRIGITLLASIGTSATVHRGVLVNEFGLPELVDTAARASINERCASAFLHDIRGTMQALFSAFELLGRSARAGGGNPVRVERACDLAKRAIDHHEKSTMEILQRLTLQQTATTIVDAGELVNEVAHFLRNEAAGRSLTLGISTTGDLRVSVERAKLQTVLIGLFTAAIDATVPGLELRASVVRHGDDVVFQLGSDGGYVQTLNLVDALAPSSRPFHPRDLTLFFAKHFLDANRGNLDIEPGAGSSGVIRMTYPAASSPE